MVYLPRAQKQFPDRMTGGLLTLIDERRAEHLPFSRTLIFSLLSDRMAATFASLCAEYTFVCQVELSEMSLRGLRTTSFVPAGDPVLAVPWELVLTSDVLPNFETVHRIALHHLDVARQLLDKLESDGEVAAFWRQWATLLPAKSQMATPSTLPMHLLSELQDDTLSREAQHASAYVESQMCTHSGCENAQWAVALTRSRPFTLPAADFEDERVLFAFFPFIDMANHHGGGNCEVRGVGHRDEPTKYTAVELVALRDLQAGELVTLDYVMDAQVSIAEVSTGGHQVFPLTIVLLDHALGAQAPAAQFADYGFLSGEDAPSAPDQPATDKLSIGSFTTSLAHDEALLDEWARTPPADARLAAIVEYRVHRKRTHAAQQRAERRWLWWLFGMGSLAAPALMAMLSWLRHRRRHRQTESRREQVSSLHRRSTHSKPRHNG